VDPFLEKQKIVLFKAKGKELPFDGNTTFIAKRGALQLSYAAMYLCNYMDGETTDKQLLKILNESFTPPAKEADLRRFVKKLKRHNLLFGRINDCLVSKASMPYRRWMMDKQGPARKPM